MNHKKSVWIAGGALLAIFIFLVGLLAWLGGGMGETPPALRPLAP